MKRKVRTKLLAVLLTLAMLVSVMPAAFAANSYGYGYDYGYDFGYVDMTAGANEQYYLVGNGGFNEELLFNYADYFIIYNNNNGPTVRSGYSSVEGVRLDRAWYGGNNDTIYQAYFDVSNSYYNSGYYEYTVYGYTDDGCIGYMTIYLYVNSTSIGSSIGDIYASTDAYGYLSISEISSEIYYYAASQLGSNPYYIQFTNVTNGTLNRYSSDSYGYTSVSAYDMFYFDAYSSDGYYVDNLWFQTANPYQESVIEFRVYGGYGLGYGYSAGGTIVVNGGGVSAGSIPYSTDYNTPVTFDAQDFENLLSYDQTLSYVTFTLPSSSQGALYTDDSQRTAVRSTYKFYTYYSSSYYSGYDLDEVTFVPKAGVTGDVSIGFQLYYTTWNSSRTGSISGTVVISVENGATVTYTGGVDSYVQFDSESFADLCYDLYGKELQYVKFTLPASSKGTLYALYDGTFRGSTAAKSTDLFYVSPGTRDYSLDDVVFVPQTTGAVEIGYTAYYAANRSYTGKVKITVNAGTLEAINYTISGGSAGNNGVDFSADSFTDALKAKTNRALSYVTFTLPKSTQGVLYYNDSTKVSAGAQYRATGSTNSLDKVSFVPASGVTDDVTIRYTAVDTSGNEYAGTVVIKTFVGKDTVIAYASTGPTAAFKAGDFTDACLKKLNTKLSYVMFTLPSSSQGTLYYGYGTSQQARVSSGSKYTVDTHLPYVSFLPKEGFRGIATISYTGYDAEGNSYTGSIQVTVTPPAKSAYFTDATESWVAPSADFLQANGVYSGMVSGSTLGVLNQINRGEVMQMLYNGFNLKNRVSASAVTSNFSDVPTTHPYYTAINTGSALGIALGYQGKFLPGESITRQDAVTLLYRVFTDLGLNLTTGSAADLAGFADHDKVAGYAVNAMASMVKSGIIEGNGSGINPEGNLTRGELSVILHRALTL